MPFRRSMRGVNSPRRPDQLWTKPNFCLSPGRPLRGKGPQGRQARRSADPAADDLRVGHQPQDREDPRPVDPAVTSLACRRGYSVTPPLVFGTRMEAKGSRHANTGRGRQAPPRISPPRSAAKVRPPSCGDLTVRTGRPTRSSATCGTSKRCTSCGSTRSCSK